MGYKEELWGLPAGWMGVKVACREKLGVNDLLGKSEFFRHVNLKMVIRLLNGVLDVV